MAATAKKSKYAIVNLVCKILNLGEYAKVENFVSKVITTLTREISSLKRNQGTLQLHFDNRMLELEEELEDLNKELEDAYADINPEKLSNNAEMNSYMDKYLGVLSKIEKKIERQKDVIDACKEEFKDKSKNIINDIAWRQKRIKKLSS